VCGEQEIKSLTTGDMWFDGTVISVIPEALVKDAGAAAKAIHLSPRELHSVHRLLENPGNANIRVREQLSVTTQVSKVTIS